MEHAGTSDPDNFPFILMGNKVDKAEDRNVEMSEAKDWTASNANMPYFETSAMNNTSVDEAFVTVIKKALEN